MNSPAPPQPMAPVAPMGSVAAGRAVGWRLGRVWDQVSMYLPVLLMALLALGSYWLLRATPEMALSAPERPVTHEPDYFMRRFSVKAFDVNGVLKSEIHGTEARHHPDTDTVEIDQARIKAQEAGGQRMTASAQRVTSNAAQTEFVLEGDAIIVREGGRSPHGAALPRLEFRGESLRVYTDPKRFVSERPVQFARGGDRIQADSIDYQDESQIVLFSGRVKAHLVPR